MRPLTPKQRRFVAQYGFDLNATQAAIRAGYSKKTADSIGLQLLRKTQVKAAVEGKAAARLAKADLTAERTLEEMRRLAFANWRNYYDEQGNLKPVAKLSEEESAAIASGKVIHRNLTAGDGVVDELHEIRLCDKQRALETLMKHFGLLMEKVEHSGALEITWKSSEGV